MRKIYRTKNEQEEIVNKSQASYRNLLRLLVNIDEIEETKMSKQLKRVILYKYMIYNDNGTMINIAKIDSIVEWKDRFHIFMKQQIKPKISKYKYVKEIKKELKSLKQK